MSVLQNINGSLYRMDASDLAQLAAVDTEGILGGTPGATTNGQTLVDQLAADDVQAQTDIGQIKTDLSDQAGAISAIVNVYGSKNILDNNTPSKTENGVTFTVNNDKSVTVSTGDGGATADTAFDILSYNIPAGSYTASGITGGSTSTYLMLVYNNNYTDVTYVQSGDTPLTLTGNYMRRIRILIKSGQVLTTPIVFYPMIRDARIKDPTYAPYAMTNMELTEVKSGTATASCTSSNATVTNCIYRRCGNITQLRLIFKTTTSLNVGSTISFNTTGLPRPYSDSVAAISGYAGNSGFLGWYNNDGTMSVRVIGANIATDASIMMVGTFIAI